MRNLLEAIAVNCLLRSDAQRSYADYLGVAFSLPFQADTNTGMGILFKAYGDTVCHMSGGIEVVARTAKKEGEAGAATRDERETIKDAKEQVLGLLQDAFPNVKNVRAELERGFRFWNLVRLLSACLNVQLVLMFLPAGHARRALAPPVVEPGHVARAGRSVRGGRRVGTAVPPAVSHPLALRRAASRLFFSGHRTERTRKQAQLALRSTARSRATPSRT